MFWLLWASGVIGVWRLHTDSVRTSEKLVHTLAVRIVPVASTGGRFDVIMTAYSNNRQLAKH